MDLLISLSACFLDSSIEIEKSISSCPQLVEEVFLNAATLIYITRPLLLGNDTIVSGRFSIQTDRCVSPFNRVATRVPVDFSSTGLAPYHCDHYSTGSDKIDAIQQLLFINH